MSFLRNDSWFIVLIIAVVSSCGLKQHEGNFSKDSDQNAPESYPALTREMILSASVEASDSMYDLLSKKVNHQVLDSLCKLNGEIYMVLTKSDSLGCAQSIFFFDTKEKGARILDQFEELNPFNVKINDCSQFLRDSVNSEVAVRIDFHKFCVSAK